jgi:chromate transporter
MTTSTPQAPGEPLRAPASLRELFFAFNRLALQGFGGVLPVAQRELVERLRWLTKDQFGQFAQVPSVAGALRGMSAVAAGLIISTALKLLATVKRNPMGLPTAVGFAALTFIATALLHWPLVWVIVGLGACAIAVAWRRLRPP